MAHFHWPVIKKAKRVAGKTLVFRDATLEDAAFIVALRTDDKKSRYLKPTSSDIEAQRMWLEKYASADDQAYFIIEFKGEMIGTIRLYDARQSIFCWGSWILKDGSPTHAAMESALMVYAYAVEHLGFQGAHVEVRKANESVWKFKERFGARRTSETEHDYVYDLDLQSIENSRARYKKFLPCGVTVI